MGSCVVIEVQFIICSQFLYEHDLDGGGLTRAIAEVSVVSPLNLVCRYLDYREDVTAHT